jgi:protein SCO1
MSSDEPKSKDTSARPRPKGVPLSLVLPLVALAAIVASVTVLLISHRSTPQLPGNAQTKSVTGYDGQVLEPIRDAPSLGPLRNYLGEKVDLASYRGKAVFVTFLYTHCPDICPLITSQLHNTLEKLGPDRDKQLQVVAVSVDPRGDNPRTVAAFLKAHEMTGRMKFLIGSAAQLGPVWKKWNVGSTRDAGDPELVSHSALIYGISASGKLVTIYPDSFQPKEIVHDLPKLLAE